MENNVPNTCLECKNELVEDSLVPIEATNLGLSFCNTCWKLISKETSTIMNPSSSVSESQPQDFERLPNESVNQVDADICKDHEKKTNLICIQDKRGVCKDCVLFGSHKGHEVMEISKLLDKQTNDIKDFVHLTNLIQFYSWKFSDQRERELRKKEDDMCSTVTTKYDELIVMVNKKREETLREIKDHYQKLRGTAFNASQIANKLVVWKDKMTRKIRNQSSMLGNLEDDPQLMFKTLNSFDEDASKVAEDLKIWIETENNEQSNEEITLKWGSFDAMVTSICVIDFEDKTKINSLSASRNSGLSDEENSTVNTLLKHFVISLSGDLLSLTLPSITNAKNLLENNKSLLPDIESWFRQKRNKISICLDFNFLSEDLLPCNNVLLSKCSLYEVTIEVGTMAKIRPEFLVLWDSIKGMLSPLKKLEKYSFKLWGSFYPLKKKISCYPTCVTGTGELDPPAIDTFELNQSLFSNSLSLTDLCLHSSIAGWNFKSNFLPLLKSLSSLINIEIKSKLSSEDTREVCSIVAGFKSLKSLKLYAFNDALKYNELTSSLGTLKEATKLEKLGVSVSGDGMDDRSIFRLLESVRELPLLKEVRLHFCKGSLPRPEELKKIESIGLNYNFAVKFELDY